MMLIGLGYSLNVDGSEVKITSISRNGLKFEGSSQMSLKEAEKLAGEGKFSCGDSNG